MGADGAAISKEERRQAEGPQTTPQGLAWSSALFHPIGISLPVSEHKPSTGGETSPSR